VSFAIDVNILLYASDAESPSHDRAAAFLHDCATGCELFCIAWTTAMSYLRIATHPAIFSRPLTAGEAMDNLEALLALAHCRTIGEEDGFWQTWREVTRTLPVRGNAVRDAHLTCVLRQHGVRRLYTHDRDFRRFDFLEVIDPLA
jgi:toxin-antitoxin system PIN domain toxin